jgi:filamentous hemagglutinin family protein
VTVLESGIGNAMTKLVSLICLLGMAMGSAMEVKSAVAQVTPDGTLGAEKSVVTPNVDINGVNSARIDGGAKRGANLFHSFEQFNIGENGGAYFSNPDGITNIISRVTGSSTSNINGTLGVLGSANLFFINPNGIIFGANARLDIGGSFIGSTASSLRFGDGIEFSTKNSQSASLLTISVPTGLQYEANPQDIRVQGISGYLSSLRGLGLRVPSSKTLALVGGNLIIEGAFLNAPNGQIELGSIAGTSRVNLNPTDQSWTLNYQDVENFGNIRISRSFVDVAIGENIITDMSNSNTAINIRSAQLDIVGASVVRAGTLTTANGPDIKIDVQRLIMGEGATVSARTFGVGEAGNLNVNASELVKLSGSSAGGLFITTLTTDTHGEGKAGSLTINTEKLVVEDGAQIGAETRGSGNGGNLTVNAAQVELRGVNNANGDGFPIPSFLSASARNATASGGDLTINTKTLLVQDGAQVGTGTFGKGDGGNLTINAETVEVSGVGNDGPSSGLFTQANSQATGKAGNLSIITKTLLVQDGAQVSASAGWQK